MHRLSVGMAQVNAIVGAFAGDNVARAPGLSILECSTHYAVPYLRRLR